MEPSDTGSRDAPIVLVVDDNPTNVDVLVRLLRADGYEPAVALSGEKALDVAPTLQPDVVLMDVEMPGLSGFAACRILNESPETADIPVIFVTGHSGYLAEGFAAGAVDFITKPIQAEELRARLHTHLRLRRLRAELEGANSALAQANAGLERRVSERTRQLAAANRELAQEVQQRQLDEQRLAYMARHDPLTRLLNRAGFEERVRAVLTDGVPACILRLDLENFQLVNDIEGEQGGDQVLTMLGSIVRAVVPDSVAAARTDGDEVTVLMPGVTVAQARSMARDIVDAHRSTLDAKLPSRTAQLRVGIAEIPDTSLSFHDLMGLASTAATLARRDPDRFAVLGAADVRAAAREHQSMWRERLQAAIDTGGFVMYGQPVIKVSEPEAEAGAELLIRWKDPDTGAVVSPGVWHETAATHRLFPAIDRWAVDSAIGFARRDAADNLQRRLSVNVSGQSLSDPTFLGWLGTTLGAARDVASRLSVEITETTAIDRFEDARLLIDSLHELGLTVALDDFGQGFASYGYLQKLPFDVLKIDGQFIKDLDTDSVSLTLARSMNDLGHSLGMTTVAEFVERQSVLELVREMGVDLVQGFLLATPVPYPFHRTPA